MSVDAVLSHEANQSATSHLLQHFNSGDLQEDLCFALWTPSSGATRRTAIVSEIIPPIAGDRTLHGNASFNPQYISRALSLARARGAGLAFMHSHPTPGWQGMSATDVATERDIIAYPAGVTGLPLVGLTIGTDGYWSARFWQRVGTHMSRRWCDKVRVVQPKSYKVYFNDASVPPVERRQILKRTFDTWGPEIQSVISRLSIGIVGLGSVGCIVAETLARVGVSTLTLIDPDRVETHNLDRLLYSSQDDIGLLKVQLAERAIRRHATADGVTVAAVPLSVQHHTAYKAALDCDVVFSCVDRPVARDVLNYVAYAHLIPVIDGGIAVETRPQGRRFFGAHWRAHLVTPYRACMRCNGQYDSSMVVTELDGSLSDPSYVASLPREGRPRNENVFPFSVGVAAMEVNLLLHYLLAEEWWPMVGQQDYQFVEGKTLVINKECHQNCSFQKRRAKGDLETPPYLVMDEHAGVGNVRRQESGFWRRLWLRVADRARRSVG